jgi:hypothetical protein
VKSAGNQNDENQNNCYCAHAWLSNRAQSIIVKESLLARENSNRNLVGGDVTEGGVNNTISEK